MHLSPPAPPGDFAGVLDEALAAEAAPEVPLAQALARMRERLPRLERLGPPGAGDDLFSAIDELAAAVSATYPQSLCRAGCGRCCQYPTAFFDLDEAEWELIAAHVATAWPEARRAAFLERFQRTHGPYRGRIAIFEWLMTQSLPIFPTRVALPLSCPFLEDERCSIYEVRPFPCRTFGSFTAKLTAWSPPHVYACAEQSDTMAAAVLAAPLPVYLPDLAPLQWKQLAFMRGKKRVMASWIRRQWLRGRKPPSTP